MHALSDQRRATYWDPRPWQLQPRRTQPWHQRPTLGKKNLLVRVMYAFVRRATTKFVSHAEPTTAPAVAHAETGTTSRVIRTPSFNEWRQLQHKGPTQLSRRAPESFRTQFQSFNRNGSVRVLWKHKALNVIHPAHDRYKEALDFRTYILVNFSRPYHDHRAQTVEKLAKRPQVRMENSIFYPFDPS